MASGPKGDSDMARKSRLREFADGVVTPLPEGGLSVAASEPGGDQGMFSHKNQGRSGHRTG